MSLTKEQLTERAQLVRLHEGNCAILFPTASEAAFRVAIMKKIAQDLGLKELKGATIAGAEGPRDCGTTGPR